MIQIKYSMTQSFDSFYQYYGFIKSAARNSDYCSDDDFKSIHKHMIKLYNHATHNNSIEFRKTLYHDFVRAYDWLKEILDRGDIFLK